MQLSFEDRTYLVTGGGSGIGKGVAAGLVASGASVMIVGRNADRLAAAVEEIDAVKASGGAIRYEPADVTNEDEVTRAVEAATAWHGRLHGAVHCAGGSLTVGPITQMDSDAWRRTVDLNINGTMYVLKHAARELVRGGGGSFVGISSIAASNTHRWFGRLRRHQGRPRPPDELAADELGPSWVRVNSIRPGLIRTDMVAPASPSLRRSVRAITQLCTPIPRFGEAEDIANMAMFLLAMPLAGSPGRSSTSTAGTSAAPRSGLLRDDGAGVRRRRSTRSRLKPVH